MVLGVDGHGGSVVEDASNLVTERSREAALLDHMELIDRAAATGARILVPTGALIGLDAVRAAAEGTIASVKLVSRKPPSGLLGAPYLEERGITLTGLAATLVFGDGFGYSIATFSRKGVKKVNGKELPK